MLSPDLKRLHELLGELEDHNQTANLLIEDDCGGRWSLQRAFTVGARTDDPGLVIRLTRCI